MSRPSPFEPGSVRGLIFDLDGTLVDSYAAIGDSLNHARAHYQLPPLSDDEVRRGVGRGLESLIAELVGEQRVAQGVRLFRQRYAEVFEAATFALPDVRSVLSRLSAMGYPMTVASNKPAPGDYTVEVLEGDTVVGKRRARVLARETTQLSIELK